MDFGRRGVAGKQKDIKSTSKRLVSKFWVMAFRLAIVVFVCGAVIGTMAGFGALKALTDTAPDVTKINVEPKGFKSYSYYSDGTLAQAFIGEQANRMPTTIEEIPKMVQDCFVALEDERFYTHDGIDIRGIFRAGYSVLKEDGLDYGASTITQQLLKNLVFEGGRETNTFDKIVRKVQEQYLAIQLEDLMEKDQILEYYLNYINLGSGAYGVKQAARTYFDKELDELTLSEASVIAPIALSPTNRNPVTNPEKNADRRLACLENMLKLNYCTKEQYDEAISDDVYSRVKAINIENKEEKTYYSYFTDMLVLQVLEDFQKKLGLTSDEAEDLLYCGGISILTTQDPKIQSIVDKYYENEENFPGFGFASGAGTFYEMSYNLSVLDQDENWTHYHTKDLINYFQDYSDTERKYYHADGGSRGVAASGAEYVIGFDKDDMNDKIDEFKKAMKKEGDEIKESKSITLQPQSSFSIIEQSTGQVVAIYGGRDGGKGMKQGNLVLNRASGTTRPVGSTFKVLASFLPALDAGGLTLASVQDDSRYFYPNGGKEVINWYGSNAFRGLQPIRAGIYQSLNIVAVKTLAQIGPQLGFEYLERLGFSTLVKSRTEKDGRVVSDINLSLALGGLTDGVKNLEMTAAYAAIANNGVYNKPICYTKILDGEGKVILSNENPESSQVMKASTAWLLTSAMLDTVTRGTGSNLGFKEYKMPVAGKTGTTTKDLDFWFCGYTPYYTATIWTGYDHNNFSQKNKNYHQHMWRKMMEEIHQTLELPYVSYDTPDSIVSVTVCTKCGKLGVGELCGNAAGGSCLRSEYFAKGTVPSDRCDCHIKVTLCTESKKLAGEFCPEELKKSAVYLVKDEKGDCTTYDTPYIISNLTEFCNIHTEAPVTEPTLPSEDETLSESESETPETSEEDTTAEEVSTEPQETDPTTEIPDEEMLEP